MTKFDNNILADISGIKEKIIHIYYNPNEGLGNLFRSAFCNYTYCKSFVYYDYDMHFEKGPLELCFNNTDIEGIPVKVIYGYQIHDTEKVKGLLYNKKEFTSFIENKFKPTFLEMLNNLEEDLGDFDAIHIRCGDQLSSIPNPHIRIQEQNAIQKLQRFLEQVPKDRKYVLYTDSKLVKNFCKEIQTWPKLKVFNNDPIHTAYNEKTDFDKVQCLNTALEFFSLRKAKKIYSFIGEDASLSTFSMIPAFLYDIPLYMFNGVEINEEDSAKVLTF